MRMDDNYRQAGNVQKDEEQAKKHYGKLKFQSFFLQARCSHRAVSQRQTENGQNGILEFRRSTTVISDSFFCAFFCVVVFLRCLSFARFIAAN